MPHNHSGKTVYILGAGFSAPAGGPKQELLLKQVFALRETRPKIREYKESLRDFLTQVLHVARGSADEMSLEDIYKRGNLPTLWPLWN